jgi:hypothetical protein
VSTEHQHVIAMPGDAHEVAEQTAYENQLAAEKLAKEQKDKDGQQKDKDGDKS